MAGRVPGDRNPTVVLVLQAAESGNDGTFDGSSPQRHDGELRRMAAFRVHETANRIAILANSAGNDQLREKLLAICQRLLGEERALLDGSGPTRAS